MTSSSRIPPCMLALLSCLALGTAQAVTLSCSYKEGMVPPGTPPLELRFDEAGNFEYGTNRQKMDGQVTETFVFFANSKDLETGWFVNRMNGDLFYVGRVPAQSKELLKMPMGHCRSIAERQF